MKAAARSGLVVQAQIIGGHQYFETELNGDIHILNIVLVSVLVPVVKIFHDFLKHHATAELSE
jgi:hypothetical protein